MALQEGEVFAGACGRGGLGCWDEEPRDGWRGTVAVSLLVLRSPGDQGVVLGAFLQVSPFPQIHYFAVLNPTPVQGSSSLSAAHRKEKRRKREKDRERATKGRDAWEGLDPPSWGTGASTCEIAAQTLIPLLPQSILCSEHPA